VVVLPGATQVPGPVIARRRPVAKRAAAAPVLPLKPVVDPYDRGDWEALRSAEAEPQEPSAVADGAAEGDVKKAKSSKARNTRMTERDVRILRFLTRYQVATYPQLAAMFDMRQEALRRRMPKLERLGLVKPIKKNTACRWTIWMATDEGAAVASLNLPAPKRLSPSTTMHSLGLTDLGIYFERRGETVVTEAEIRAADLRNAVASDRMLAARGQGHHISDQPIFAVSARDATSHKRLHVPDLVLVRPVVDGIPRSVAIELETQRKAPDRVRRRLKAFAAAANIGDVHYFTPHKQIRDEVDAAAIATGTSDIVKILRWQPSEAMGMLLDLE
ncbi:replication-relaxation family protein, partial [uncultured Aeromicrobium sp.]|uniref:replication-relaxation family protein n=1 Tax=uncultured Aeromicrobium sp. TaxID=337820 RepID=UPI0025E60252